MKIIRACTVSMSLGFVEGMIDDLKQKYEVVVLSSPGKELTEITEKHNISGIAVPMQRHISPLKDLVALLRLIIVFLKERPTMVHSMTPKAGLLCMVAAWIARVPIRVHTFTGLVFPTATGMKRKILMFTDAITCRCATHIIPEGEGVKADLTNYGITRKPLRVLGYGNVRGIDMNRFSMREPVVKMADTLRRSEMFTFLFVGRIVGDKGINELVAAFNRLSTQHEHVRLWLVGFFEEKLDPVSAQTKTIINSNDRIIATGEQSGDNLLAYYAAADCFVFPSYREGFPNTVMEAGAMNLPSIVTDINGSREIIVEGENGVIIPPRNEDVLFEAMKQMLADENGRKRMAANARKMIADRYEQGFVRHCLYDYYEEIIAGC